MRPDFVYFDLGNVLLYFDHGLAIRAMAKVAEVDPADVHRVLFDEGLQVQYETGMIGEDEFLATLGMSLDCYFDCNLMLQATADMFIPNPHILPVLEYVKRLGLPIGLLSNTCEAHWNWICKLQYPQVKDWFSTVILSYEVNAMKPAPQIYQVATSKAGVDPSRIFFTDDRQENIEAARKHGWQAETFTSADRLMDTIRSWGE